MELISLTLYLVSALMLGLQLNNLHNLQVIGCNGGSAVGKKKKKTTRRTAVIVFRTLIDCALFSRELGWMS